MATTADTDARLDAREIDGEPFSDIVAELDALDDGETLLLVNSFEPEPLYDVLADRGFTYETEQAEADEWRVYITPATDD
ncbi:DUF2249 domain-containing protein [Halobacterium sp. KA-6]|jgi:uncharacterized protein (DUF2249 family)|uniref:DUF2249 domain-containing protein n=1 Tax=Halobacterium sp. KA-6 TaxID=2896368 RepID=UPI001E2B8334|nr:DUF2249 domain-containing protein [Halobacterium sp. KA-6]MCD2205161.1 DUF2249 domain-containing protein [Halobacterium sp. KA-6]